MDGRKAHANRAFRLSSVSTAGLNGAGALVATSDEVTILRVPSWNSSLVVVRTAAGDEGLAMLKWLVVR